MDWFTIIVIAAFGYWMLKFLSPVLEKLIGKRKPVYSDKAPDINKREKTLLIKCSIMLKPKQVKWLILRGDEKKGDFCLGRVKGVTEDRRVVNIAYKTGMLSFKRLLLVPNELMETSTLNKNLVVRANGIKSVSFGLIDIPVLTEKDLPQQERIRNKINEYWTYVLGEEKSFLLLEIEVHNVLKAPGTDKLDSELLMQAEEQYRSISEEG